MENVQSNIDFFSPSEINPAHKTEMNFFLYGTIMLPIPTGYFFQPGEKKFWGDLIVSEGANREDGERLWRRDGATGWL